MRRPLAQRGFAIVQLAVVIAALVILASALVPAFVQSRREQLAEKTARDIATVVDAARWFFFDQKRWPGQDIHHHGHHDTVLCHESSPDADDAEDDLADEYLDHRIPMKDIKNPWGYPYRAEARPVDVSYHGHHEHCFFMVSTVVPNDAREAFKAALAGGGLDHDCPPWKAHVPGGYGVVCARIPFPGDKDGTSIVLANAPQPPGALCGFNADGMAESIGDEDCRGYNPGSSCPSDYVPIGGPTFEHGSPGGSDGIFYRACVKKK